MTPVRMPCAERPLERARVWRAPPCGWRRSPRPRSRSRPGRSAARSLRAGATPTADLVTNVRVFRTLLWPRSAESYARISDASHRPRRSEVPCPPLAEPQTAAAFSLELSDDQRDIRDWVHGFAESVVRPAAAEWDEREETPWPVIQEAAKIGLYGFECIAQFWADPTGLTFPIANEELFWGDAGIGMAIMGTTLAAAGISRRHARAAARVGAPVLRHARTSPRSARSACPSPTPAPTCRRCAPAPSTTRPRTSGSSTARRRGPPTAASPTSTWSWPPSIPSWARAGRPRSSSPRARPASRWAPRSRSTASARPTPRTCSSTTAASPARACSAARRSSTSAWRAPARARAPRARPRCRPSRSAGPPSAPRRSASRVPRTSTRSTTPRSASSSAGRSSRTRRSPSRSPT